MKFNLNFLNVIFFASQGTWQPEEHPKGSLNLIDQVEKEKEKRRKRKELKTNKSVGAQTSTKEGEEGATKKENEDVEEYEVEKILDKRLMKGNVEFPVKWIRWEKDTWEPARDLGGSENLTDIFDKAELAGWRSDVVADLSVNNDDMGMWNISNALFVKTEAPRTHKN